MVSFLRKAFVVVKLKVFKVLRTDSTSEMALFGRILGPYSPKYDPILPKFSPEIVI